MRILFDLSKTQPVGNTKFHGGGKYGLIVFKQLMSIAPEKTSVYFDKNVFLDEDVYQLIKNNKLKCYYKNEIDIYDAARQEGGLIYSPLFNSTYNKMPPDDVRLIVTQHGLRELEMRSDEYAAFLVDTHINGIHRFFRNFRKKISNRHNQFVEKRRCEFFGSENIDFVTVSEHSKASMEVFFPNLVQRNIPVFYSPSTINHNLTMDGYKNPFGKYWLIVSANRWIKNGIRAMLAFDELFSSHPNIEGYVVVTGLKKWSEIKVKIKNPNRFKFVGYIDERTLKGLYHNAYALVYPSLNEGFGYPPLEAMYEGCPVIASSIASIPEICGNAALYFNPYLISEMKMRILQMENQLLRSEYVKLGRERQFVIEKRQEEDLYKFCDYLMKFVK